MQIHEFESAQAARDHVAYKVISSNKAEQFFGLVGMKDQLEQHATDATHVTIINGMPTTVGQICRTVLATLAKSDGHFEVDPEHPDGQLNYAAMNCLLQEGIFTQPQVDAFVYMGMYKPNKDLTDEQYAEAVALNAFVPVEVESTYSGHIEGFRAPTYEITTANQGLDIEITSDVDCFVTVYLLVCNDNGDQSNNANFARYEQPVGHVQVKDGRGILSLSSRKVRLYNRIIGAADRQANITLKTKSNRG